MRRVRYRVAASLDGFIAGPNGEIDWIVPDPTVDFASLYANVDTVLLGRRTYELTMQPGAPPCSKTSEEHRRHHHGDGPDCAGTTGESSTSSTQKGVGSKAV